MCYARRYVALHCMRKICSPMIDGEFAVFAGYLQSHAKGLLLLLLSDISEILAEAQQNIYKTAEE